MLKKLLITAGCIALSSSLSSCSYISKLTNGKSANNTPTSYETNDEVSAAPTEDIMHHHHVKHRHAHHTHGYDMPATVIVSEDGLKEISCTEVTYSSTADKIQILGYLPAGTPISQKQVEYVPPKPKKIHPPKAKKPKAVKKDSYNAPAKKAIEAEPVTSVDTTSPVATVEIQSAPTPTEPVVTNPVTTDTVTTPAPVQVTPPAPITAPAMPTQDNQPASNATPSTMPSPAVVPVPQPLPNNPTAIPMANEQVPAAASNTVSIGRLATFDYAESQVDIPASNNSTLDQIAADLKQNPGKNVKIQSYAFSKDGNATEARRNSLQRAIKVRKYLIDKDVSASRISVNAIEDINNKLNKVEISFEEAKQ